MNPNLQRGLLLYQQARPALAEAEFRQALGEQPDDAHAHAMLALCLAQGEKFAEATTEAQTAVHLQPDFPFAHYALAHVMFDRRHYPEAQAAIEEAIRLDPSDADYFSTLGAIHLQESRWKEALAAADQGLQFDAQHIGCTNLRAVALVKLGRRAEAGLSIDAALARNPESAPTHANQGWTLLEKGDPKKALEHFREALRLDPENQWARQGIVEALKARNLVYAVMLKYFLWMSHFNRRGQWAIVLGGYFGNNLLGVVARSNPAMAPWILPIQLLYACFALMTWMAVPLFNLLLRVNRFGRLVLTREQTVASNWFGLCLLGALVGLAFCCCQGFEYPWLMVAMVFGCLLCPVAGTFLCPAGWPRTVMAVLTNGLLVLGLGAIYFALPMVKPILPDFAPNLVFARVLFFLCLLGSLGSTWVVNILRSQRRRR